MEEQLTLQVVARIRSDFTSKFGIPRQSNLVPEQEALVVFDPAYRDENALRGLEGYSHLWLIWGFSEVKQEGWSPMVKPPKLGGNKRMGVFATRSPFRPNPLGLSSVRLVRLEKRQGLGTVLVVSGADLMDGSPIYDIKPYLSFTDSHPEARDGFAADHAAERLPVSFPAELLDRIPEEKRPALLSSLALDLPNPVVWFGIEKGAMPSRPLPEISDATHCIRCKTAYEYDYVSYGHLGGFRCPHCGYRRHPADVAVTEVVEQRMDGSSILLSLRGEKHLVNVNLPAVYNIYNAAGAVAAVTAMGLPAETAIQALGSFQCGFGRMEQFDLGQAGAKMMLVKNPAGCNQVIEFLQNVKEPFVLAVFLNDRGADGTDVSWIWDADFEGLQALGGRLTEVIVSGDRAGDMRVRMKYAGIPDGRIRVERDYARLVDWIAGQEKPVFLMPTYTAMLELRQAVIHKVGGQEFWEK